jgi:hypothetical protein
VVGQFVAWGTLCLRLVNEGYHRHMSSVGGDTGAGIGPHLAGMLGGLVAGGWWDGGVVEIFVKLDMKGGVHAEDV